jgi:hypothetical protein
VIFRWLPSRARLSVLHDLSRSTELHSRQFYVDLSDSIVFMSVVVSTSGGVHDDFLRFLFLHPHREDSDLVGELSEECDQFRFLQVTLPTVV